MEDNIYATPKAELNKPIETDDTLASRWSRLWAATLDGLAVSVITMPVLYFSGGFDDLTNGIPPSMSYILIMAILGLAAFIAINGKLLVSKGQTVGKKVLGIKIVDIDDELTIDNVQLVKRYATLFLPRYIPFIGPLLSTINVLFIYSKEKRCIHDRVAETKVVNC